MSLNWQLPEGMTTNDITDEEWGTFQSLVFNCIPIGIPHLKDAVVFYDRYVMYYTSRGWETYYDYAFVKRFEGLRTNVSPKSDAVFNKECLENLKEFAAQKRISELNKAVTDKENL